MRAAPSSFRLFVRTRAHANFHPPPAPLHPQRRLAKHLAALLPQLLWLPDDLPVAESLASGANAGALAAFAASPAPALLVAVSGRQAGGGAGPPAAAGSASSSRESAPAPASRCAKPPAADDAPLNSHA
jgi:hypothetical protein